MHLDESPFALTNDVLATEIGTNTVGAILVNGVVLLGAGALIYFGVRKMLQGALGKSA